MDASRCPQEFAALTSSERARIAAHNLLEANNLLFQHIERDPYSYGIAMEQVVCKPECFVENIDKAVDHLLRAKQIFLSDTTNTPETNEEDQS